MSPHDTTFGDVHRSSGDEDDGNTGTNTITESASELMEYVNLDSDGENDEGTGWDIDELAGECEADFGIDEDGPQQPELLLDVSLLEAVGGVGQIKSNAVPKELLKTMAKTGWAPLTKQTPYEYLIQPYEPHPPTAVLTDYMMVNAARRLEL
ncbi:hypothetical protein PI124_g9913 [Phytophthora idaei]|nr:hypothetical protein PI124_g9913 [Phytophthora idaei]